MEDGQAEYSFYEIQQVTDNEWSENRMLISPFIKFIRVILMHVSESGLLTVACLILAFFYTKIPYNTLYKFCMVKFSNDSVRVYVYWLWDQYNISLLITIKYFVKFYDVQNMTKQKLFVDVWINIYVLVLKKT